jgi:hypothetical protein
MDAEPKHNARDPETLSDPEIRAGYRMGWMRMVMIGGLILAVIGMVVGFFVYGPV